MTVTKFLLPKKPQITLIQLAFTYSKQTMETPEKSPKSEILYCSDVFTIDFKKVNIDWEKTSKYIYIKYGEISF